MKNLSSWATLTLLLSDCDAGPAVNLQSFRTLVPQREDTAVPQNLTSAPVLDNAVGYNQVKVVQRSKRFYIRRTSTT